MISALLSRVVILVFGTLYPAYASFKAIRTKNVKEYVKWMMYWIVFALFCAIETFTDVLLSWLPFYYEVKILFVIWMLLPVTKGSSYLYKKFVHPHLSRREKEIDEYIDQYSKKGYTTLLSLGTKGLTYATNVVVSTAIKGQSSLVDHIRKSYSTNDLRVTEDTIDGHQPTGSFMLDDDDLETIPVPQPEPLSVEQESAATSKSQVKPVDKKKSEKLNKQSGDKPKHGRSVKFDINSKNDDRIAQDNREIERRKTLRRSQSDASDLRPAMSRYKTPTAGLSRLEEVEEEYSYPEGEVYVRPGYYSPKQVKMDPYGTLPRTRARTRNKIPK